MFRSLSVPSFSADNTDHLRIRPYHQADLPAIATVYNESILKGGITMDCHLYSAEDIRKTTAKFNQRETILVAQQDQQVIGWGIIKRYSDRWGYRVCCETSVYLALSEKGKGYGKLIQQALLQKVKEFGYHHVVAKILAANQTSIEFHLRFGFEIVGIQKEIGFYQGKWHNVVIMQLILPDIPPYRPNFT